MQRYQIYVEFSHMVVISIKESSHAHFSSRTMEKIIGYCKYIKYLVIFEKTNSINGPPVLDLSQILSRTLQGVPASKLHPNEELQGSHILQ